MQTRGFQVMCDVCGGRMYGVIADLRLCFRHWSEAADGWSSERVEAMEADGWWKWQIRKVFGREHIYE